MQRGWQVPNSALVSSPELFLGRGEVTSTESLLHSGQLSWVLQGTEEVSLGPFKTNSVLRKVGWPAQEMRSCEVMVPGF